MKAALGSLIVLSALLASPGGLAGDEKTASVGPATSEAAKTAAGGPATGEVRSSTVDQSGMMNAGALKARLQAASPTAVEEFSGGRVRARLGPEYRHYAIARLNDQGKPVVACVPASKAEDALKASAPASPAKAEK